MTPDLRTIVRITCGYDIAEDRLRIAVLDSQGMSLGLWLTRRLANRLISALLGLLNDGGADSNILQAWQQEVAVAAREAAEPVQVGSDQEFFLITAIDLNKTPDTFRIVFRWQETVGAAISFAPTELRQWLDVLHEQFRQGEWSDPLWPDWITAKAGSQESSIVIQ